MNLRFEMLSVRIMRAFCGRLMSVYNFPRKTASLTARHDAMYYASVATVTYFLDRHEMAPLLYRNTYPEVDLYEL